MMKKLLNIRMVLVLLLMVAAQAMSAQQRRPIDSKHPMWLIHVDVWNKADPQKIIDLIPDDIKPYVCMNLSLSCAYNTTRNEYERPQNAVKTYKSWATVCQKNGMWFTCQPASGGHTHIQDWDLETFEYFFKTFPNFLGWNYAEQFWGFDEANDKSSSPQATRIALFAKLVPMHHQYGGVLTVSFCGNIWSHPLNPLGMMKRNKDLLKACQDYPEAILWLYKYTTSSCFYNNESVSWGPFVAGLAKNYGVRYDNCGWNGATDALVGEGKCKYPVSAGIGTVMEQMCVNGGAVWDGPELIWTEDFEGTGDVGKTTVNGYTRRGWKTFKGFDNAWIDMFRKIIDGTMYIPTREEVLEKTKIVVINDVTSGSDEQLYAAWGDLYDGVYKQTDPFNRGDGRWMNNFLYLKSTGRYGTIPIVNGLYDDAAKNIPVQVKKSNYTTKWSSQYTKTAEFNRRYPQVSTGDLYVNRFKNQLVTYTPYSYMNKKKTATANIPLKYNTCESMELTWGKLSSGIIHEYSDHIDFYLNNYRTDTTTQVMDKIVIKGASAEPTYELTKRVDATVSATPTWDAENGTYTLEVNHMGPLDLTINCAGNGTERSTDVVSQTPLSEDLPKQPEEYNGIVTIEAEDMDYKSIQDCVLDPFNWYKGVRGHAGNGFANMGTNTAGSLRHEFTVKKAGNYYICVRYTAPKKGVLGVKVNGSIKALSYQATETNEWKNAVGTATYSLREGKNTLTITNTSGVALYIDNVTYRPEDAKDYLYGVYIRESEHGTVTANVSEAAEGEEVTLTVKPESGYVLKSLQVINSIFYTMDVYLPVDGAENGITFTMPDDNMTLQPVFEDTTSKYKLDLESSPNGTVPEGWYSVQDNGEVHTYPTSYTSGARIFAGFTGYQGKGLYWRTDHVEYGSMNGYPLTLESGEYKVTYAMAAWKESPTYRVEVLNKNGTVVASSEIQTATPNANGVLSANLTSSPEHVLEFTVEEAGDYIVRFKPGNNTVAYNGEFLLLECSVNHIPDEPDAIELVRASENTSKNVGIFDASGVRHNQLQHGLNIIRTADGQVKKIFIK